MDRSIPDAHLVAAFLDGDREALGVLYDRYAASVLDLATGMLRDRDDAADVVQDVFVAAADNLGQLQQPERLRAWLFAIARHEVLRRIKARGRTRSVAFTDAATVDALAATAGVSAVTATSDPYAEGARVQAMQLAGEVRAAAAGLDTRDQLVLELVARQGLSGADLADALGVTEAQSHVLVHRMRDRISRSLRALTVARMNRRDCPSLAELLRDWDGRFTVLVRKRVARHMDRCAVCAESQTRFAGIPVLPLLAALPTTPLPTELRDRVLVAADRSLDGAAGAGSCELDPSLGSHGSAGRPVVEPAAYRPVYRFDNPGGFPGEVTARQWRAGLLVAVLLTGVLAMGGWWVARSAGAWPTGDTSGPQIGTTATNSTTTTGTVRTGPSAPAPTGSTEPGDSRTAPIEPPIVTFEPPAPTVTTRSPVSTRPPGGATTPSGIPTTSPATTRDPTTRGPRPGRLVLGATLVDLGSTDRVRRFTLSNTGDLPLTWVITEPDAPWSVSPTSGTLAGGVSTTVGIGIDRTAAVGSYDDVLIVTSDPGGERSVQVRAVIRRLRSTTPADGRRQGRLQAASGPTLVPRGYRLR
ncbi:MAG: hypothetical protein CSA84_03015 [Actinomycetales bacterium]|nr:MAG: hypothetical protein CSA84_03015 [Actinomycetales bacterium]